MSRVRKAKKKDREPARRFVAAVNPVCDTRKTAWKDRGHAMQALVDVQAGPLCNLVAVYRCSICHLWHHTSKHRPGNQYPDGTSYDDWLAAARERIRTEETHRDS